MTNEHLNNQVPESMDAFAELQKYQAEGEQTLENTKKAIQEEVASEFCLSHFEQVENKIESHTLQFFLQVCEQMGISHHFQEKNISTSKVIEELQFWTEHLRLVNIGHPLSDIEKFVAKYSTIFQRAISSLLGHEIADKHVAEHILDMWNITPDFAIKDNGNYTEQFLWSSTSARVTNIDTITETLIVRSEDPILKPYLRNTFGERHYTMTWNDHRSTTPTIEKLTLNPTKDIKGRHRPTLHPDDTHALHNIFSVEINKHKYRDLELSAQEFPTGQHFGPRKLKGFRIGEGNNSEQIIVNFEEDTAPSPYTTVHLVPLYTESKIKGVFCVSKGVEYYYYIEKKNRLIDALSKRSSLLKEPEWTHIPSAAFEKFKKECIHLTPLMFSDGDVHMVVGVKQKTEGKDVLAIFNLLENKATEYPRLGDIEHVEGIQAISHKEFVVLNTLGKNDEHIPSIGLQLLSFTIDASTNWKPKKSGNSAPELVKKNKRITAGDTPNNYSSNSYLPGMDAEETIEKALDSLEKVVAFGPSHYVHPHVNGQHIHIERFKNPREFTVFQTTSIKIPTGRSVVQIVPYYVKQCIFVTYKNIQNDSQEIWMYSLKKSLTTRTVGKNSLPSFISQTPVVTCPTLIAPTKQRRPKTLVYEWMCEKGTQYRYSLVLKENGNKFSETVEYKSKKSEKFTTLPDNEKKDITLQSSPGSLFHTEPLLIVPKPTIESDEYFTQFEIHYRNYQEEFSRHYRTINKYSSYHQYMDAIEGGPAPKYTNIRMKRGHNSKDLPMGNDYILNAGGQRFFVTLQKLENSQCSRNLHTHGIELNWDAFADSRPLEISNLKCLKNYVVLLIQKSGTAYPSLAYFPLPNLHDAPSEIKVQPLQALLKENFSVHTTLDIHYDTTRVHKNQCFVTCVNYGNPFALKPVHISITFPDIHE